MSYLYACAFLRCLTVPGRWPGNGHKLRRGRRPTGAHVCGEGPSGAREGHTVTSRLVWQGTAAPLLKGPTGQARVVMVVGLRTASAGMGGAPGQPMSCLVDWNRGLRSTDGVPTVVMSIHGPARVPTYFHTFVERLSRIDLKCVVVFWEWLITCSLHAALGRSARVSPNYGRRCIRSPQMGPLASPRHATGGRRRVRRD